MDMLDRYITEVGRYLPRRQREDVKAELRSTLQDMLDDRVGERQPTEADVAALLEEYGSPRAVASSYSPDKYLVGPDLYPLFMLIVKAGLGALAIAFTVLLVIGLVGATLTVAEVGMSVLNTIGQYVTASLAFIGSVLIVMIILQRLEVKPDMDEGEEEAWDPRKLPAVDDRARVNRVESGITVFFIGLWLVILNYFRMQGGIVVGVILPDQFIVLPLPQGIFWMLIVIAVLQLGVHILVLRDRRWTPATRLARLALDLASFYYTYQILGLAVAWGAIHWPVDIIVSILRVIYRFYPLVAVITVIDAAKDFYQMFIRPPQAPSGGQTSTPMADLG